MTLTLDWERRIQHWMETMTELFYEPLGTVPLEAHLTYEQLSEEAARAESFKPIRPGTKWGAKWQYGWFRGSLSLPKTAKGKRIVFRSGAGSECAIYVDCRAAGAWDREHKEITLARRGVPGKRYDIMIEAYGGHGPRVVDGGPAPYGVETVPEPPAKQVAVGETTFGIWHEELFQLWVDTATLWSIRQASPQESLRVQEIDRALREMTVAVDLELPIDDMLKTVADGRRILAPLLKCRNGSTAPKMYCFGHSHIDVAHLWHLREAESKCVRTFGTQLAMLDEYKEMTFLQSQPHLYNVLKQKYPKIYRRIKQAAKGGRWIPEGGMWVEPDTNVPSGESLIRQFIHGKRFFRDEFGIDSQLLWLPDVFGYSGALPQIMRGCGVPYFSTMKITWAVGRKQPFPYNSFWWQGIDGTRVFAHIHNDYASETDPATLINRWNNRQQKDGQISRLVPYGHGDGGGGPTRKHLEYLRRQENLEGAPKARNCHPLDFFHDEEKRPDWMPTYVGELYFQNHRGTYTTEAKTKKGNRQCELALRDAELWAAAAQALAGKSYPLDEFDGLWKQVLLHQFHDILPGSSIQRVFEEAEATYSEVLTDSQRITEGAIDKMLARNADAVSVFNSLSWERDALVPLPEGFKGAATEAGESLPSQVIDGATFVSVPSVPSCGWNTIHKAEPKRLKSSLKVSRTLLESEVLRVSINDRGELTSIYDKEHDRELATGACNQFRMFKDVPFNFDAWNIDAPYRECPVALEEKATITVKEKGPLRGSLLVTRKLNDSLVKQEIRLCAGSRVIEFVTTIDWREKHKLLKVAFPVEVHANEALHEIQFGHLARPNHESNDLDAARFEVCQQKWTALVENSHGVALLNDCKYGIDVRENVMSLTLLKSPLAPNMFADIGTQEFSYAFYAWNGSFADSDVVQKSYELNVPVKLVPGHRETTSLFTVDQPNVIIEAVKAAEDGSGDIIVRLYESKRMHGRCTLTTSLPVSRASIANMLEEKASSISCRSGQIQLVFRPFEIKTIRLNSNKERV